MCNKVGSRTDMSIIGTQSGVLTVLALEHTSDTSYTYWRCRCEKCGKEVVLRRDQVKLGIHRRCEKNKDIKRKNGALINTKSFASIRKDIITAAKELGYSEECIKDLKTTETEDEIEKIMRKARHGGYSTYGKS